MGLFVKKYTSSFNWIIIDDHESYKNAIKKSFEEKILIFKHSTRCSISHMAKSRIEISKINSKIKNCFLLDVLTNRKISNEIQKTFNIKHESPQIIIVSLGKGVQNLSHLEIKYENID